MKTAQPIDLEHELRRARKFLDETKYPKAQELLESLDREFPRDEEVILALAECYHLTGKTDLMRSTLLNAQKLWPDRFELPLSLAESLLDDELPEEAEVYYRQALTIDPQITDEDLSYVHTGLGNALWDQHKRDDALASWRRALELDPENDEANEYLNTHTNEFNEPASPVAMFDDLHHFRRIHTERYYKIKGKDEFSSESEANAVIGLIMLAWNEHIAPLGASIDPLPASEKTRLFESVQIDFPHHFPSASKKNKSKQNRTEKAEHSDTPEEQRLFQDLKNAFPFLPGDKMAVLISIGGPILANVGFPVDRLIDVMLGSPLDDEEKELIIWADALLDMIALAVRNKGRKKEIEWIMEAKNFACLELDEDVALALINDVRTNIEETLLKTDEEK